MIRDSSRLYSKGFKKVTHCLFDMDGTVLNTEVIYHKEIAELCSTFGKKYTKDLEKRLHGETDREVSKAVVREMKLPISADEFELRLQKLMNKAAPSAPLMEADYSFGARSETFFKEESVRTPIAPVQAILCGSVPIGAGAERLLFHLYDYDVPMALATNSTHQAVRLHYVARPKLFGMFQHMVSISDVELDRGKPKPDIYLVAADKFPDKPKPAKVVMIPEHRLEREYTRHATLVLNSLTEFRPELFGLPPFVEIKIPRRTSQLDQTQKYEKYYLKNILKPEILGVTQKDDEGPTKDEEQSLKLDSYVRNLKSQKIETESLSAVKDVGSKSENTDRYYRPGGSLQSKPLPPNKSGR